MLKSPPFFLAGRPAITSDEFRTDSHRDVGRRFADDDDDEDETLMSLPLPRSSNGTSSGGRKPDLYRSMTI